MAKVKCLFSCANNLTKGNIYETTGIDECGQLPIIDDNGELIYFQTKWFEDSSDNICWVEGDI